jgi:hypothetical protein
MNLTKVTLFCDCFLIHGCWFPASFRFHTFHWYWIFLQRHHFNPNISKLQQRIYSPYDRVLILRRKRSHAVAAWPMPVYLLFWVWTSLRSFRPQIFLFSSTHWRYNDHNWSSPLYRICISSRFPTLVLYFPI